MHRVIVWFRNDLRVHDNPVLHWAARAAQKSTQILPVYCFDPRFNEKKVAAFGIRKCGVVRTKFMIESVAGLR